MICDFSHICKSALFKGWNNGGWFALIRRFTLQGKLHIAREFSLELRWSSANFDHTIMWKQKCMFCGVASTQATWLHPWCWLSLAVHLYILRGTTVCLHTRNTWWQDQKEECRALTTEAGTLFTFGQYTTAVNLIAALAPLHCTTAHHWQWLRDESLLLPLIFL